MLNLAVLLEDSARNVPDRDAVVHGKTRLTYAAVTEADLIAWCRRNMAAYKYPRIVEFGDDLPMTATGKILERELG